MAEETCPKCEQKITLIDTIQNAQLSDLVARWHIHWVGSFEALPR